MNEVAIVVKDKVVQKILFCQRESRDRAGHPPKTPWEFPTRVEIA